MSHYSHFTTEERELSRVMKAQGFSDRAIARSLKRSNSSVSREFANNPATDREDIAEIKYTVTNNTDEIQNAGLRIMIDTQLGYNDAAPFRIPQYGSITSETEFAGDDIPQTDPNGNTIKNTHDSNGNLSTKNSSGNMLSMTDAEGHNVSNSYNSKGQLTSINAMGINAMTVQYDSKRKRS